MLNRGVGRTQLFGKDRDYEAFEEMIEKTRPMRICAYCLLSNHWHFVLWPERDGQLGDSDGRVRKTARALGLESTLRARGWPRENE